MRAKSQKNIEVEEFVDKWTLDKGQPPTYAVIAQNFKIAPSAAWNRCKKFRDKLVSFDKVEPNKYSASVVYNKANGQILLVDIISAANEDEALGIAINKHKDEMHLNTICLKVVVQIK